MRNWFNRLRIGAVGAGIVFLTSLSTAGQAPASTLPRSADGHPLLNGLWQTMNTAHWDIEDHAASQGPLIALGGAFSIPEGSGVVEGGRLPYRPEAMAKKKENYAKSLKVLQALT